MEVKRSIWFTLFSLSFIATNLIQWSKFKMRMLLNWLNEAYQYQQTIVSKKFAKMHPCNPYPSTDSGQPTNLDDSTFICEICMEVKSHQTDNSFGTNASNYLLCSDCTAMYPGINDATSDIEDEKQQEKHQVVDAYSAFLEKLTFICEICLETKSQYECYSIKSCTYSYCSECMAMYPGIKRDDDNQEETEDEIQDSTFVCKICVEPKNQDECFTIKECSHCYCSDCMCMYVASKLQENVASIKCPEYNCLGALEPELCQTIMPREVFERWSTVLCESLILSAQKFYCPFNDCSALLLDEGDTIAQESECPHCHRLFCAQCKVPWHSEIKCEEFQKLNEGEREREDIMLMKLAKEQKWQRCPECKFYVERSQGCKFLQCRCGCAFCYNCAARMENNNHNCFNCLR